MHRWVSLTCIAVAAGCTATPVPHGDDGASAPIADGSGSRFKIMDFDDGDVKPTDLRTGDPLADSTDLQGYLGDIRALARAHSTAYRRFLWKAYHRTRVTLRGVSQDALRGALEPRVSRVPIRRNWGVDRYEYTLVESAFVLGGVRHHCVLRIHVQDDQPATDPIVDAVVMLRATPNRTAAEMEAATMYSKGSLLGQATHTLATDDRARPFKFVRRMDLTYGPTARWRPDWEPEYQFSEFHLQVDLEVELTDAPAGSRWWFHAPSHLDPALSNDGATMLVPPAWTASDTLERVASLGGGSWWQGEPETVTRNMRKYGWSDDLQHHTSERD